MDGRMDGRMDRYNIIPTFHPTSRNIRRIWGLLTVQGVLLGSDSDTTP